MPPNWQQQNALLISTAHNTININRVTSTKQPAVLLPYSTMFDSLIRLLARHLISGFQYKGISFRAIQRADRQLFL